MHLFRSFMKGMMKLWCSCSEVSRVDSLNGGEGEAKAAVGAGFGGRVFCAVRGTFVPGGAAKTSAAIDSIGSRGRPGGVGESSAGIRSVPVAAPLPEISGHVGKAP